MFARWFKTIILARGQTGLTGLSCLECTLRTASADTIFSGGQIRLGNNKCLLVLINVVGEAAQTYLQYTVHTTQPRILFRIYCCSLAIYFYFSIEYIIFPLLCIFLFGMFLCLFSILLFFFCTLFQIFPILVTHFLFLYNAFLFIIII